MKPWFALFVLLGLSLSFAPAQAEDFTPTCLQTAELKEISSHFEQFKKLIDPASEKSCSTEKNDKWFKVAEAVAVIHSKTFSPPPLEGDDVLTYRAVDRNQFWSYLTRRADRFDLTPSACESYAAYVWDYIPGEINICSPFLRSTLAGRAEILLHEVRHFDGFSHVVCRKGAFKGVYACDRSIGEKGSYAVSVQALALMGLDRNKLSADEKIYARYAAVFGTQNNFIKIPPLKVTSSLFLEDGQGGLFLWSPSTGNFSFKMSLPENVSVFPSNMYYWTFYPKDSNQNAYRSTAFLLEPMEAVGDYAKTYNAMTPSERSSFREVSYREGENASGLLVGARLRTLCDNKEFKTFDQPLIGQMENFVALSGKTYLKHSDGSLYSIKCKKGKLSLLKSDLMMPLEIKSSFDLGGVTYALNRSGQILRLEKDKNSVSASVLENPALQGRSWVQAFSYEVPHLFLQDDLQNLKGERP
jgi:hypothetical protein